MPYQILKGAKVPIKVFVDDLKNVESVALDQLRNTANLPWVTGVSAMPDVHWGKGATVGSVIVSREAVSPAVVGVDIGCGVSAMPLSLKAEEIAGSDKISNEIRNDIEKSVPTGFRGNEKQRRPAGEVFAELRKQMSAKALDFEDKAFEQLGSLGGGNHFIEICSDESGGAWVLLHSGSRNIGKMLADHHLKTAKGLFGDLVKKFGEFETDENLAALIEGTRAYSEYIQDLTWCQAYAKANRTEMMRRILDVISNRFRFSRPIFHDPIDCHHNYIEKRVDEDGRGHNLITRKGAVSARPGEYGIIPGSMGAKSYIVLGKGNPDSFESCAHGAGRRMSRRKARDTFTTEDLEKQTEGVNCRKDNGVVDEIPGAYKDIDMVMENQKDLVSVAYILKQFICVKG